MCLSTDYARKAFEPANHGKNPQLSMKKEYPLLSTRFLKLGVTKYRNS